MKVESFIKNLLITDIADEGRGMGRDNGLVVFVERAVPGDIVDVKLFKKKKAFAEGFISELIQPSPDRVQPFCEHFGICGGCKWQYLDYEKQLMYKQNQVFETLSRIGRLENLEVKQIIGSEKIKGYRNKLEFTFSDKRYLISLDEQNDDLNMNALGFHIPRRFDKILDINACYLMDELNNRIRNFVREFCLKHEYTYSSIKQHTGLMRSLIIRNTTVGDCMVIVVFREDATAKRIALLDALKENFPEITSLISVINPKRNDTINDLPFECYAGKPFITEQLENLNFRIGPNSFFQTNSGQTLKLYETARSFAQLTGNENVYDLYTGTGTIAQFIAHQCKHVTGIEYEAEAIEDAKSNAALNQINNASFFAGDMQKMLKPKFFEMQGKPDVIITDPPRAGMHADVTAMLNQSGAKRIVYVSCNVATQARDIELLSNNYCVTNVQPVDMFPHTAHVENVALLELKN